MKPKVSICIPVYNVEKYIEECLETIVNQTYTNIEIIVVNDCTPDRSMDVVRKYAAKDDRIKILNHNENKGLMRARETGYKAATGDYITFCDSDDKMPLNSIETLLKSALDTGADITSGEMQQFIENKILYKSHLSLPFGNNPEAVYQALLSTSYSHTLWSKLFKNDLFKDHNFITLDHATNGEDGILFYQVLQYATQIVHIPQVVYYYRINPSSSTHLRLKSNGIYSILFLQCIRNKTCGKYNSLTEALWRFCSSVINGFIANGYDKEVDLKNMLKKLNLSQYTNYKLMFKHIPFVQCVKLMALNIIKPYYYIYLIKRHKAL